MSSPSLKLSRETSQFGRKSLFCTWFQSTFHLTAISSYDRAESLIYYCLYFRSGLWFWWTSDSTRLATRYWLFLMAMFLMTSFLCVFQRILPAVLGFFLGVKWQCHCFHHQQSFYCHWAKTDVYMSPQALCAGFDTINHKILPETLSLYSLVLILQHFTG